MSICLDSYSVNPKLIMSYHVIPGRWLLQGGSVGGSGVLRWFEQEFGAEERAVAIQNGTNPYIEMDAAAEKIPAGADGMIFLPYMAGERSPIWDPAAKGVYYGLDFSKKRAHFIRANMESVAYSLRHNLETASNAGASVKKMFSVGGAANSRLWTQIKADITGIPIDIPSTDAATTLGAAMLAGVAVGLYKDFEDAVRKTVRINRSHMPDLPAKPVYDSRYQTYLSLYEQLKPIMQKGAVL
jgi:xylulokinase